MNACITQFCYKFWYVKSITSLELHITGIPLELPAITIIQSSHRSRNQKTVTYWTEFSEHGLH
jgi:hypothetical protein